MIMIAFYDSKEIAEIRKLTGLTTTEWAAKLGVTQGAAVHWENGIRSPKVEHMKKIARIAAKHGYQPNGNGHGE